MNEPLTPWISALSLSLLHFLWQGLLIGAIAALALRLLKNARPQLRYALTGAALLSCFLAAASTLIGALIPAAALNATLGEFFSTPSNTDYTLLSTHSAATPLLALAPWLVAFWAAGAGWMFLRMAWGISVIGRLQRLPLAPPHWQHRLDALAAGLGLGPVLLRITEGVGSPISAGFLRPMILLPVGLLTHLSVAHVEALLAHELAHIRRHDYLLNLLQVVIEALLFYHPVVWWLSKQIRIEREQIADQIAAESIGTPKPLAHALAALAELSTANTWVLAQAARGGELEVRIKQLFRLTAHHRASAQRASSTVLLALGLTLTTLGLFACAAVSQITHEPNRSSALHTNAKTDRLSFALVRFDRTAILAYGPDDEIDQVARALPPRAEDYVLLRRNGRDALVVDASVLGPMRQAWERAENLTTLVKQNEALPEHREPLRQLLYQEHLAYRHVERLLHESIASAPVVPL